jgi:2,4-dichlorophenol 6-monooxygenase
LTAERDPDLYYQPMTHPGARLPHAWLDHHGTAVSTIDLTAAAALTLFVGEGGQPRREAAEKLAADLGFDIAVHSLGAGCEYDDVLREWTAVHEVDYDGALLVRPDHHVAWRRHTMSAHPLADLRSAVETVMHHPNRLEQPLGFGSR